MTVFATGVRIKNLSVIDQSLYRLCESKQDFIKSMRTCMHACMQIYLIISCMLYALTICACSINVIKKSIANLHLIIKVLLIL